MQQRQVIELDEPNLSMQVAWKKLFNLNFKYKQRKFATSMLEGLKLTGIVEEQNKKLKSSPAALSFNLTDETSIPLIPNIKDFTDKNEFIDLFKTAKIALVVNLESEKLILKNYQSDADDDKGNQIYRLD